MEKQQSKKNHTTLTPQELETLIDDFNHGDLQRITKWTSSIPPLSLLHLSLSSLLKPTFPLSLKLHLLLFLDNHHFFLLTTTATTTADDIVDFLSNLLQTLKTLIQSPIDNVSLTLSVKEQLLVSTTSILMSIVDISTKFDARVRIRVRVEELVEVLLVVINRPNHGVDRQIRGVACECLRELERELPGLLTEIVGHLWGICQNERTHTCQSYLLLLLEVIHDIVVCRLNVGSVFSTAVRLVPFNVPPWLMNSEDNDDGGNDNVELSGSSLKELRRVVAFLLEWAHVLTPCGMVEFVSRMMPLAVGLELQTSLLKVQFGGLLYNYDPLLWHVVLSLSRWFPDMYDGQESEICRRLVLISKEEQQHLVFRLLVLHWLLGFVGLVSEKDITNRKLIGKMESNFYPKVYDALALKAMKLDLLAFSCIVGDSGSSQDGSVPSSVTYLKDALVSVEAYKWLPSWSTETAVAFRTLHRFLIGVSPHFETDLSVINLIMQSPIFRSIQTMLVSLLLDYQKLVPIVVNLVDRLLSCEKHYWLGQKLLQTIDECLIPKIGINYRLSAYFLLFDKIGKNDTVPPHRLLELLMKFLFFLVEKQGPDSGLKSWSHGSNVLGVCRTMLMHHHSSRLFMGLSRLLAFTSLYFPDLEVRDNARIYLRMLICIPGKKLRLILNLGDQSIGLSPSPHSSSVFNVQSPRLSQDLKKSVSISSYIHLERVIPLLVKQSWSLALPALGYEVDKDGFVDGIKDDEPLSNGKDTNGKNAIEYISDTKTIDHPQEPLRVMDSKISGIVDTLRKHFSCIPDFRYMSGLKIRIPCNLSFRSEPFSHVWGLDLSQAGVDELDACPAMYGIVLKFSSSAPYGSIPSCHIPVLLGEQSSDKSIPRQDSKDIVPVGTPFGEKVVSKTPVIIELEPREPVPGLVDVSLDANAENGQVIRGKLQCVSVGIEDMFLNAPVPTEILEDIRPEYNSRLFYALWEACGTSSNSGRETFSMKGGKGLTAIYGTQSVKLLEVPPTFAIRVVERYLAPFVVSVIGAPLVDLVKDGGFIKNTVWIDVLSASSDESSSVTDSDGGSLYLTYIGNEADKDSNINMGKTNMGCFLVLIFLPPRYHLLFRMEVSDGSTLVRIRTDHWPCLAYVDDYLEALFSS